MRHGALLPSHIADAKGHEPGDQGNQCDRTQNPAPPPHVFTISQSAIRKSAIFPLKVAVFRKIARLKKSKQHSPLRRAALLHPANLFR
jgi:hypothetical protein